MKKITFLLFLLFLLSLHNYAQNRFRVGIKAGLSTSQVHGDSYAGFHKFGADGGIFVNAKFNEKWTSQLEIQFVQKGSKHVGDSEAGDYSFYYMGLNYLEVPLLFQYHQKKFTFEVGPGYGYLISSEEYNEVGEIYHPRAFSTSEITASLGVSCILIKNLSINWRYSNSILPIRKLQPGQTLLNTEGKGQRNNVLAFTLTYLFGKNETSE